MNFLEQSNGQDTIPSQVWEAQDSNPLFPRDHVPQTENDTNKSIAKQQTNGRDQNSLKVSISAMHKILFWHQRSTTTDTFRMLLREANKNKNYSTPVKFIILAKKADLLSVLKRQFSKKSLDHIKELRKNHKWSEERFMNTMANQRKVLRALHSRSIKQAIRAIWVDNNHMSKNVNSEIDVTRFNNKIKRIKKADLRRKQ